MKIFLIIFAFILFLTILPIKFHFYLSNEQNRFIISVFGIRFFDSARKKKAEKTKKSDISESRSSADDDVSEKNDAKEEKKGSKTKKKKEHKKNADAAGNEKDDGGLISKFADAYSDDPELIKYGIAVILKSILKILRFTPVKKLYIDIKAGGEDAYEAAMNYAFFNQVVWGPLGLISSVLSVDKKKICISPLFNEDTTIYRASFTANLKICDVITLAGCLVVEYVKIITWIKTGVKPETNNKSNTLKKEFSMSDNNKVSGMMGVTMDKIKEMVDVNTIIGDPVQAGENVTIIPVSKVSYGFGSGGSDLPVKNTTKDLFGGGAGAGVTIKPIGFIVVQCDDVKFIQVADDYRASNSVIDMIPGIVDTVSSIFSKGDKDPDSGSKKNKKTKKSKKHQTEEVTVETEE